MDKLTRGTREVVVATGPHLTVPSDVLTMSLAAATPVERSVTVSEGRPRIPVPAEEDRFGPEEWRAAILSTVLGEV
jgi:hypothetical protein